MGKEKNGVQALDRFVRRLSSRPEEWQTSQQVALKIEEKRNKFDLGKYCCMCKSGRNPNTGDENDIDLAKEVNIDEHLMSLDELEAKLHTDLQNGLTEEDAEKRLLRDGPNAFTPPKQKSNWLILLHEMTGGFAFIMWLTAIASVIVYFFELQPQDYYLAIVIVFVIVVTGLYSFSQQQSSGKIFESFKNMIPQETIVLRGGKQLKIRADHLVVGDVVQCRGGERIPADVRIIRCEGMKVDNSSLTGESEPLSLSPDAGHQMPLEAKNIAFFSTSCVDGSGVGVVIATGDNTVMGKIAKLVTNIKAAKSPINIEISRFVNIIAALSFAEGLTYFAICMGLKMRLYKSLIYMISIIVGNIPEGLLPAMTLGLTLTAKRMASKMCMVKYLEAVETLGSTSTICSDKTGTLTENRMTVEHLYLGNEIVHVSHEVEEFKQDIKIVQKCWDAYQRCAMLCSRAFFTGIEADIMKRECSGDASETAILRFMESVSSTSVNDYRGRFPKLAEKPFSSVYKYQFSVHRNTERQNINDVEFFVVMKGAPERIISRCSKIVNVNGETVPLSDEDVEAFEFAYRELGSMGERVLAFCDMDLSGFETDHIFNLDDDEADFELINMRFIGLVAMIDPPRASVPDAVEKCKAAGISVIMVTGDHPITAQAIAKSVGIISVSHRRSTQISLPRIDMKYDPKRRNMASIVVPGDELAGLSDIELRNILRDFNEIVFARTSPQQKLRIVDNCQMLDRIVAVTGDGVNDSPALKKADIGVAMGITGSDVSKQAADMILMDDNFSSIVIGVEEGRKIFDNLKKIISYILTGNISTLYPFIVFLAFGTPVAISPISMLAVALGTDLVPAISLAYEKAESDIMRLPPRNPRTDHLVTRNLLLWAFFQGGLIITASGLLGFFSTLMTLGIMPWELWQLRELWEENTTLSFTNIKGELEDWSYERRMAVVPVAQSSYFVAVVVAQWMDVIVHRTRRVSIFKQGFGNWFLNFSLLFETGVCCLLVYTPGLNTALSYAPVPYTAWLMGLPFFCYLFVYEELRKYVVRRWPDSFLGQELCK